MAYTSWSVVFGEQPSAAKWNILGTNDAYFDSIVGSGTAWTSWTPTYTNMTVGNGTHASAYQQLGKTVHARVAFTFGSSSSMGTNATFSLPVTASSSYKLYCALGSLYMEDAGSVGYLGNITLQTTTTASLYVGATGGTFNTSNGVSTNTPTMTGSAWATADYFSGMFTYQAA